MEIISHNSRQLPKVYHTKGMSDEEVKEKLSYLSHEDLTFLITHRSSQDCNIIIDGSDIFLMNDKELEEYRDPAISDIFLSEFTIKQRITLKNIISYICQEEIEKYESDKNDPYRYD